MYGYNQIDRTSKTFRNEHPVEQSRLDWQVHETKLPVAASCFVSSSSSFILSYTSSWSRLVFSLSNLSFPFVPLSFSASFLGFVFVDQVWFCDKLWIQDQGSIGARHVANSLANIQIHLMFVFCDSLNSSCSYFPFSFCFGCSPVFEVILFYRILTFWLCHLFSRHFFSFVLWLVLGWFLVRSWYDVGGLLAASWCDVGSCFSRFGHA